MRIELVKARRDAVSENEAVTAILKKTLEDKEAMTQAMTEVLAKTQEDAEIEIEAASGVLRKTLESMDSVTKQLTKVRQDAAMENRAITEVLGKTLEDKEVVLKELAKARTEAEVSEHRFMALQNSLEDRLPDTFETETAIMIKEEAYRELQKDYNNLRDEYELLREKYKSQHVEHARDKVEFDVRINSLEETRASLALRLDKLQKEADDTSGLLYRKDIDNVPAAAIYKMYQAISADKETV